MKTYVLALLLISGCSESKEKISDSISAVESSIPPDSMALLNENSDHGVTLTMEGQTYTMEQKDINPQTTVNFEDDDLKFVFYTNESTVSINLNLTETDILNLGSAAYAIPEVNLGKVKVDLNFFNQERQSSRTNKRIVFRKGEIQIEKITKNELVLTFKGEGSGMMDRENSFPIEGSINIAY